MPAAVGVVIPARNEEALLPACLDAVDEAVDALHQEHPGVLARVFVVLDACGDRSAEIVAQRPDITAVVTQAGNVGVARALGVAAAADWALSSGLTSVTGPLWLANTDGDSVVPRDWLRTQVRLAAEGRDLVVGSVLPRPGDLTDEELALWRARHSSGDGHAHVHGANLGFTWDAYESVGGFAPIPTHEDVELVAAMRHAGASWVASGRIAVTTSGRRVGRAPGGFADYLGGMGA